MCVVLGHVDTGKTKLLDKIRSTNVQDGEAGGITQQIGATFFPASVLRDKTSDVPEMTSFQIQVPGLLIIDTPGHESFSNLRSRGSSLCDIAILVVDIMHGLEPQTLESLQLLRNRKTPFIVALNKIDRIYGWASVPNGPVRASLDRQAQSAKREFQDRVKSTITAFAEEGLNARLFYENRNPAKYVSLVPTSAITGEGIPDLLMLVTKLTQDLMADRLLWEEKLACTVLEVKAIEGLGTTIDVILTQGSLKEGDTIVLSGSNGPIVTQIRALLTPREMRELRIKSDYVHHKSVRAAQGIKISAPDLENALPGSPLLVLGPGDDEMDLKDEVMGDLQSIIADVDHSSRGVCVQASTLGSLEALLQFLRDMNIPVHHVSIGTIHKKDVINASIMLEEAPEFAVILAFDVKVSAEAREEAEKVGVRIFEADIIYHLFDQFTKYMQDLKDSKKRAALSSIVFPAELSILQVFNMHEPIIMGVRVNRGILKVNTPLCLPERENFDLGTVVSIQRDKTSLNEAREGSEVAIRVEAPAGKPGRTFGRHFGDKDPIVSKINRSSIDLLKEHFKEDLSKSDWKLVVDLKKILGIP